MALTNLNPTEHLWQHLKLFKKSNKKHNLQRVFVIIQEEWVNIPLEVCRNLVHSMNRRCREVIKQNGYASYYLIKKYIQISLMK